MNRTAAGPQKQPFYLPALQCLAYVVAVEVFVRWAASGSVANIAAIGAAVGCALHELALQARIRWQLIVLAALVAIGLGLWIPSVLQSSPETARAWGVGTTIQYLAAVQYGLIMFASVLGLRGLATRWPAIAVVEAALLIGLIVIPLAGHRDFHMSQPQALSDWAFAHGYDPSTILYAVGIAAVLIVALLRFECLSPWHTLVVLGLLLGTAGVGSYFVLVRSDTGIGTSGASSVAVAANTQGGTGSQGGANNGKPAGGAAANTGTTVAKPNQTSRQDAIDQYQKQQQQGGTNSRNQPGGSTSGTANQNQGSNSGFRPDRRPDNPPSEPGKTNSGKTEPGKTEPGKTEPGKAEPGKAEPGKAEPGKAEPGKPDSPNATPSPRQAAIDQALRQQQQAGGKTNPQDQPGGNSPDKPNAGGSANPPAKPDTLPSANNGSNAPAAKVDPKSNPNSPRQNDSPQQPGNSDKKPPENKPSDNKPNEPPKAAPKNEPRKNSQSTDKPQSKPDQSTNPPPGEKPQSKPDKPTNTPPGDKPQSKPDQPTNPPPGEKPQSKPDKPTNTPPGDKPQSKPDQPTNPLAGDKPQPKSDEPPDSKPRDPKTSADKPADSENKPQEARKTPDRGQPKTAESHTAAAKPADAPHLQDDDEEEDESPDPETLFYNPRDFELKPTPMVIVTLHNECPSLRGQYYFRDTVYSRLAGELLTETGDPAVDADQPRSYSESFKDSANRQKGSVLTTVSLLAPNLRPLGLVAQRTFEPRQAADPQFLRTFSVTSDPSPEISDDLFVDPAGDPHWSPDLLKQYLAYPHSDPRYKELAQKIVVEELKIKPEEVTKINPLARLLALSRWLGQNAIYSLRPKETAEADRTAAFLFGDRRGYCLYMAYAMTYMSRSLGVPTRVAVGYHGSEARRGMGSSLLLLASDRHAWCEVYLDRVGWYPVDVFVAKSEEKTPPEPDRALQNLLGEKNRKADLDKDKHHDKGLKLGGWGAAALALFWALGCLYGVKLWRWVAPLWSPDAQLYRLCYRAALDRFTELGLVRASGETREEFALRVANLAPEFAELSAAHTHQWLTTRPVLNRESWLALQLKSASRLTTAVPRGRRWRGLLNPVSWFWTR